MSQGDRSAEDHYAASQQPGHRPSDIRNGEPTLVATSVRNNSTDGMSRAERFEEEKRRIIDSCFSKKDADGSLIESYITHVRVIEDAAYPSSPAPPDSAAENRKSRVIVVAVRKSGRVRVHKARQNPAGTFSIGKTWNLDDLSSIQAFGGLVPANPQEEQYKQWASSMGFMVTLGRPYYWQASTAKEKDFFIGSLMKIYRKYTGGKLPELLGFSPQEHEQFTGMPAPRVSPDLQLRSAPPRAQPYPPLSTPSPGPTRPIPTYARRVPSREDARLPRRESDQDGSRSFYRPATQEAHRPQTPDDFHKSRPGAGRGSNEDDRRAASREGYNEPGRQPSREQALRKQASHNQVPYVPGQFQGPRPRGYISPQSSQSSLQPGSTAPTIIRTTLNGISPASSSQSEAVRLRPGGAPSSDSLQNKSEKDMSNGTRPSTATSRGKTPEPRDDRAPIPEEPVLGVLRPGPPRPGPPRPGPPQPGPSPNNMPTEIEDQSSPFPIVSSLLISEPNTNSGTVRPTDSHVIVPAAPVAREENQFADPSRQIKPSSSDDQAVDTTTVSSPPAIEEAAPSNLPLSERTAPPEPMPAEPKLEEEHRPGLGPMVKKRSAKDVASAFRRAALAATAFQPRAGGAGQRLMSQKEKVSNGPDGMTGVVPAPVLRGMSSDSARSGTPDPMSAVNEKRQPFSPVVNRPLPKVQIQRTGTEDIINHQHPSEPELRQPIRDAMPVSPDKPRSRSPRRRRRQLQEANIEKYCSSLGIDPKIIAGRGGDFNDVLTEFGWKGKLDEDRSIDDFTADVRREIGRAQATGWLGHIEQQEGKVEQLGQLFDKTVEECEELDGLLTLYSHELSTLADDVAFIEAQSQGLQVQTANQRLLQAELQNLLETISITSDDLDVLCTASLESPEGLQAVEQALATLYRAMITIDPDIRQNKKRQAIGDSGLGVYADTEIGQMRAVREKKENYREQTSVFLRRLNEHMSLAFKMAEEKTSEAAGNARHASTFTITLNVRIHDVSRQDLWMYNALMLFVREVNTYEWQTLMARYEMNIKNTYQDQFRDNVLAWKKKARKLTGEEQELLFTSQEKEKSDEGITTAARKLTIKRGKTLKTNGTIRPSIGDKDDGKVEAFEAFAAVLEQQAKLISEEQNFSVYFFHLTSLNNMSMDFAEMVAGRPPAQRRLPNLSIKQTYDPDREMARMVERLMDNIYSFWPSDMQVLIDWVLSNDQMQCIGVLSSLERFIAVYEETNQEYLTRLLRTMHDRVVGAFHRFVDEQVRAIEDTKIKIKKRKGIISFMKTFPTFSAAVENMVPVDERHESLEVRFSVNDAYARINKAMWESLNFIAKEDPAASGQPHGGQPAHGDPEDKEALNHYILLIENMNHFIEEVDSRSNVVLEEWRERATHDLLAHLSHYSDAVIWRPLGKWLDFIESTEVLMKAQGSDHGSSATISSKPSHSRSSAKKILTSYDAKEVRKGVDALKKRIEKHFSDVDDPSCNKSLVVKVFNECSARYADAHERMRLIVEAVYDGGLDLEWRKEEVSTMFKR